MAVLAALLLCPVSKGAEGTEYLFRLAPEADKEAFAAMLEENANLAWNVCMAANTVIVETDGDFVLFMMCDENK